MKLPIVSEDGDIIGTEERDVIHEKGILHPTVHVLIKRPNGKFVFQRRSDTKDVNPSLLTYSVGGHVELNQTPQEAVLVELEEETGIKERIENLTYLGTCIFKGHDERTKNIVHDFKYFYGYNFSGGLNDLKIEDEDGAGFEEFSLKEIKETPVSERLKFVKGIYDENILRMFEKFNI
jgi:8-oxo-dGTP pyrophosphatase MutT (NUDIX family)